jgi:hypothetical protein
MAFARSASTKEAPRIAREPGTIIAPPRPCAVLAAMSCAGLGAKAHHSDEAAKSATPKEKTRRRP